uniref:General transcription factor 3C polypeptide 3 n=1 Tax=Strigamia maritima TaxID=126957 RepID=T1JHP3_STRMM
MDEDSLFSNLESGQLTEEQWVQFKELKIQRGNLVCNEIDSDDEDEYEEYDELQEQEQDDSDKAEEDTGVIASGSDSDTNDNFNNSLSDQELNKGLEKYLNGELTFTQYSNLLEGIENEGIPEETTKDQTKKTKTRTKLPRKVQHLLGEANLNLARQETDEAIKMCMEIIRLAPRAPQPFQTLGMVYEELGDMEKSLQFSLIAAFLSPNDPEEWLKLAEMSINSGDLLQAVTCYTKALKSDPNNVAIHWERCLLLEQLGKKMKALEGYQQMLKLMKPEQAPQCWQLAREICKSYHEMGETALAIITMMNVFEKFADTASSEDLNILMELQISLKKYEDTIQCFQKYGNITFHRDEGDMFVTCEPLDKEMVKNVVKCTIANPYPIDLRVKLVIVLLFLEGFHLIDDLIEPLFEEKLDEVGDLYLDLAEAFSEVGLYSKAAPLLSDLVKSENYNMAAVWLRYAECLKAMGKSEEALLAYSRVMTFAPNHAGARMASSTLLQQMGRTEEAIDIVKTTGTVLEENAQLSLQCCNLLLSQGDHDQFIEVAVSLLDLLMPKLKRKEEILTVICNYSQKRRAQNLKEVRKELGLEEWVPCKVENVVSINELWDLFLKLCDALFNEHRYGELQHLTLRALCSKPLTKNSKEEEIEFLCLLSCYFNRNAKYAYNFIKQILLDNVNCNRAWNLFGQIVSMAQEARYNRFCLRFASKYGDNLPLFLLNGHNALVSGSYKHALGDYQEAFKLNPLNYFASFMIGLAFTHMTCQKFTADKHTLFIQAVAFFNRYTDLRGECQETLYNMGRAMHQLGLTYIAVHYYKKALDTNPTIQTEDGSDNIFDLKCEIAYNLSLIYRNSGSDDLAAWYIHKYCKI